MTGPPGRWQATISVDCRSGPEATWLAEALGPEATREVPRAAARVELKSPGRLRVTIEANDAGAMRAALNTYLGWVELSLATVRAARGDPAESASS